MKGCTNYRLLWQYHKTESHFLGVKYDAAQMVQDHTLSISHLHGSPDILICGCFNIDNPTEVSSLTRNVGGSCLSSMQTGIFSLPHFSAWLRKKKKNRGFVTYKDGWCYIPIFHPQICYCLDVIGGAAHITVLATQKTARKQLSCFENYAGNDTVYISLPVQRQKTAKAGEMSCYLTCSDH